MATTALGDFAGWTEAQLLAARAAAQADYAAGKTIISAGSGDVNAGKQMTNNPLERIRAINAALFTLYLQDAVTFVAYEGLGLQGCNQVRATFTSY